ncbi:MAG: GAP family protein [Streptosporangiaceae bacterium]
MVLNLVLIGLAITLEPFPLTAFILLLSAEKGIFKGLAFVLGWLACLVIVLAAVLLTTQGKPPAPNTSPSTAALAVKLALGVALVLYAVRKWRRRGTPSKPPTWMARLDTVSPWAAAGLAAFLQPWTLVAAGAATITQAKLSGPADYLTLVLFVLLATASFLILELYATFAPAAAGVRLQSLRTWLDTHRDQVIVLLSLLIGLWLTGNSLYYLV